MCNALRMAAHSASPGGDSQDMTVARAREVLGDELFDAILAAGAAPLTQEQIDRLLPVFRAPSASDESAA